MHFFFLYRNFFFWFENRFLYRNVNALFVPSWLMPHSAHVQIIFSKGMFNTLNGDYNKNCNLYYYE